MKSCYLFCDRRSINSATTAYIEVVSSCLRKKDYEIKTVHRLKDMHHPDLVFVVSAAYFIFTRVRFPKVKIIVWHQGIVYEEAKVNRPLHKRIFHYFAEKLSVRHANMLLFTSEGMLEYYKGHVKYNKDNYVIMPCFNMSLTDRRPEIGKYEHPTFVYAGSTAVWQCFDTMLDVYAIVEKAIPSSQLYLYCKIDEATKKSIEDRGIKHYEVNYVTVDELQNRLMDYKYGFILREKTWINYVATPTKMNSYLAAFVIPIFSDGVEDFNSKIDLGPFTLKADTPIDAKRVASMIIDFEEIEHNYDDYINYVESVFRSHYDIDNYKTLILEKVEECILSI